MKNNLLGNPLQLQDCLIVNVVADHVDSEGIDLGLVSEESDIQELHNLDRTYYSRFVTLAVNVIHLLDRHRNPSQRSGEEQKRRYDLQIWSENCRWKRTVTWQRTWCFVDSIALRRLDCCDIVLPRIR